MNNDRRIKAARAKRNSLSRAHHRGGQRHLRARLRSAPGTLAPIHRHPGNLLLQKVTFPNETRMIARITRGHENAPGQVLVGWVRMGKPMDGAMLGTDFKS
jgi:hypothetical protein